HGWNGHLQNVSDVGQTVATYVEPDWDQPIESGGYVHGLVTIVTPGLATVKLGKVNGLLSAPDVAWTKGKDLRALLKVGDLVYVRVTDLPLPRSHGTNPPLPITLAQEAALQVALLALEASPGVAK